MSESISPQERIVDTAVIPIAGLGTRMWPYTAGNPKFMAPISAGNQARPNIDFTLDDCVAAGIKNLVFITSNGGDEILKGYLGDMKPDVIEQYEALGKFKDLEKEQSRRAAFAGMNIEYVNQPVGPYGTAVPLSLARPALQGIEHFAVTGGDDFIWSPENTSELGLQIAGWRISGADNSIMGKPVPLEEGPKYGILKTSEAGLLTGIAEKPALETLSGTPLANISRYILSHDIWPHLDDVMRQPRNPSQPEYYVTDVINNAVSAGQTFDVHAVQGMYFDAGSSQGMLQAGNSISAHLLNK
jgi:UTP--glucose-1-phosphate uridylyltransferase